LTPGTDKMYQNLDPSGITRNIILSTTGANAGDRFVIANTGDFSATPVWLSNREAICLIMHIPDQLKNLSMMEPTGYQEE